MMYLLATKQTNWLKSSQASKAGSLNSLKDVFTMTLFYSSVQPVFTAVD